MLGRAGLTFEGIEYPVAWGVVFLLFFSPAHSFNPSELGAAGGGARQPLLPPFPEKRGREGGGTLLPFEVSGPGGVRIGGCLSRLEGA